MARLEHIVAGAKVRGIADSASVEVIRIEWIGSDAPLEPRGRRYARRRSGKPLREMLMEAVLYGDGSKHKIRMGTAVDGGVDTEKIRALIKERKLTTEGPDPRSVKPQRGGPEADRP